MTQQLEDALKKRGRVWGAANRQVLRLLRTGSLPCRLYPTRPQQPLGNGAFVTRVAQR